MQEDSDDNTTAPVKEYNNTGVTPVSYTHLVDQGATFVHAVIREILLNAIDASKALGVDSKDRKQWQYVLNHLVRCV